MPRSHALFAPFANRLEVDGAAFEWTVYGADFYFRSQSARLNVVCVVPGRADFAELLAQEDLNSRVQPYALASPKVSKAWRAQTCWRFWPGEADEEFLLRSNFGLVRFAGGPRAQFAYEPIANYRDTDELTLRNWRESLDARDADFRIARTWLVLPDNQRLAQLVEVRGGRWDELIALIAAAFVLWAQPGNRCELDFTKAGAMAIVRAAHWPMTRDPIDASLEFLSQHWLLRRADLNDFGRYWRGCDAFGDPMDVPQPIFKYGVHSQHERLEALLLWRNWLRDKALSDEFAALWHLAAG